MPSPNWDDFKKLIDAGLISIPDAMVKWHQLQKAVLPSIDNALEHEIARAYGLSPLDFEKEVSNTATWSNTLLPKDNQKSFAELADELKAAKSALMSIKSALTNDPNVSGEENMSTLIAQVKATYNYDNDVNFVYPDGYRPVTYQSNNFPQQKPFKALVFKAWGKVVDGIDTSQSGGHCFLGDSWIDNKVTLAVGTSTLYPDLPEYGMNNFALVGNTWAQFFGEDDDEVILLSLSYGHKTVALVLVNRRVAQRMDVDGTDCLYAAEKQFQIRIDNVAVPHPFNQQGDYNTQFKHYNHADVTLDIELNEQYGLMMAGNTDFKNKVSSLLFFPSTDKHIIPPHLRLSVQGKNCFNAIADVLWYAEQNNYLTLDGSTVHKAVKSHGSREGILVKAIAGSAVKEERLERFTPPEPKAPFGLDELPLLPKGYHYIGDASGFVYITDNRGERLLLPYEIFDVSERIEAIEKLEAELLAKKKEPNEAVYEMRRQIGLIKKLFEHQAALLEGKAFSYQSHANVDFTKPNPFEPADEDDEDLF